MAMYMSNKAHRDTAKLAGMKENLLLLSEKQNRNETCEMVLTIQPCQTTTMRNDNWLRK